MKRTIALLTIVLATLLSQEAAFAHAIPLACLPRFGRNIAAPPAQVICQFSEPLLPERISMTVTGPNGARVDKEDTQFYDGDDHTLVVSLDTRAMPPGIYTVNWEVQDTIDQGVTSGTWEFGVNTVVPPTPTPVLPGVPMTPTSTKQTTNASTDLISRFLIGVGLVVLFAVGVMFWRSRRAVAPEAESDTE